MKLQKLDDITISLVNEILSSLHNNLLFEYNVGKI
jgi:hypothetical protein